MAVGNNWVRYETHIGWEEVDIAEVYRNTIFEHLFEDWLEKIIDDLIEEAGTNNNS